MTVDDFLSMIEVNKVLCENEKKNAETIVLMNQGALNVLTRMAEQIKEIDAASNKPTNVEGQAPDSAPTQ